MSQETTDKPEGNHAAPGAGVDPAPGGTLAQYVEHLRSVGRTAVLSSSGKQAWVPGERGQLQRFPLECTGRPDPDEIHRLLRLQGVWLVNYMLEGNGDHPANCFDYVCRDTGYGMDGLPSNARRDIRRGLRRFSVRLCTCDELAEKGFPAHADTLARHGDAAPSPDGVRRYADRYRGTPFLDIWGAWQDDRLAAWMAVIKVDDWAMVDIARSCTAALKDCPNNAVLYEATRRMLVEEKHRYVTYGLSTLQVNVDELSMHKYKVRMGYEAIPVHRAFVARPLLSRVLKTRAGSWMLEKAAGALSKVAILRKAAGLSRLMSGREKTPLAWAQEKPS